MKRFVEGEDRTQGVLLPEFLDDYVAETIRSASSTSSLTNWVRSIALSRVNTPFLAENCTNPFSKDAALALEKQPRVADGGKLLVH
jgi:hypothetical protein